MKKFITHLIKSPDLILLYLTIVYLVAAALYVKVYNFHNQIIFNVTVLLVLAEVLTFMALMLNKVNNIDNMVQAHEDNFCLISPPHTTEKQLQDMLDITPSGQLTVICYGTNKFGQVLEHVAKEHFGIRASVLVCTPEKALNINDNEVIRDVIVELRENHHFTVHESDILPTIRAALLRTPDGTPIWASVSSYLIYSQRRGLKSEGCSPILMSDVKGSIPMMVLAAFIDKEFERLKKSKPKAVIEVSQLTTL